MPTYLDTSTLAKLVVAEDELTALKHFLAAHPEDGLFSAALSCTELFRAEAPNGAQAIAAVRNLLNGLDTITLTGQLLDDAGVSLPLRLRSRDAIHLAARRAGSSFRVVITCDARMRAVCRRSRNTRRLRVRAVGVWLLPVCGQMTT